MNVLTPYPVGDMPRGITIYGMDLERVVLALNDADADRARVADEPVLVLDNFTTEWFHVARADCGAGCRCAASATWVRE